MSESRKFQSGKFMTYFLYILTEGFYINLVAMRANIFSTSTERSRENKWYPCALARLKVKR